MEVQTSGDGWARWGAGAPVTFEDVGAVAAHPSFPAAFQAMGASTVATADSGPEILHIAKDAGRYMTALAAIHLWMDDALTVPRLQAMCVDSGLLSAGRARDFVNWLDRIGYVTCTRAGTGTMAGRYAVTPRFEEAWTAQFVGPLTAAAMIEPRVAPLLKSWGKPAVRRRFVQLQSESLLAAFAHGAHRGPMFEAFYQPVGGVQILAHLVACSPTDRMPEATPVAVPVARVAQRFALTPMQVRRVLRRAEAVGMLDRAEGGWALSAVAVAGLRLSYAVQLVHLILPAARLLLGMDPGIGDGPV